MKSVPNCGKWRKSWSTKISKFWNQPPPYSVVQKNVALFEIVGLPSPNPHSGCPKILASDGKHEKCSKFPEIMGKLAKWGSIEI